MKRAVRILIVGPIMVIAMLMLFLVLPLAHLLSWAFDIPEQPLREDYREIFRETIGDLW